VLSGGLGLLASVAIVPPAIAAPCGPRDEVVRQLATDMGQEHRAIGLTQSGALAELFMTPDGSSWTLIISLPQGFSCIIAAGHDWVERKDPQPEV
jgi:hypothetical protein